MLHSLFSILIFPGILFLVTFGLFAEFIDRRIYARLQNRYGPPWFQPFADTLKLIGKEDIIPTEANRSFFGLAPIFAVTAATAAFFYIPLWGDRAALPFTGDIIVVLYLLTLPTLAFFIGGWYSTSLYARIGTVRCITQLFAYEVPLFMGILSAALLADSWSLSEISAFYGRHPSYVLFNLVGFGVTLVALLAKLEKVPFDIPEAETEIVAGPFTEYSGRLLAFFRLTLDIESIVGSSLVAAVFLPFGAGLSGPAGFILYLAKVMGIVAVMACLRTIFARLRIDQMIIFCWRYLVPLAFCQLVLNIILKGVLAR